MDLIMTSPSQPARYQFEYPDEAGYPDGTGTLTEDQETLIDQVLDPEERPDFDFDLVNDEENQMYYALVGDTELGGITYSLAGGRIVLLAASVHPEFRHQGVATEMIRRVLDDVSAQGKTTTIICPIVRTFIDNHPQYEPLVDLKHPGVKSAGHR
jgi:predicted GNAT family acetyltransferase